MAVESSQPPQMPMHRDKRFFLSWFEVNDYVTEIHKYLLGSGTVIDAIVTVHKGGIIPAVMLSYRLSIDDIYTIRMKDGDVIYPKDIMDLQGKNIVIVDNIIEKGDRLLQLTTFLQNIPLQSIHIVSLLQKRVDSPLVTPNFAPRLIDKEDWAIFPWEELNY